MLKFIKSLVFAALEFDLLCIYYGTIACLIIIIITIIIIIIINILISPVSSLRRTYIATQLTPTIVFSVVLMSRTSIQERKTCIHYNTVCIHWAFRGFLAPFVLPQRCYLDINRDHLFPNHSLDANCDFFISFHYV